MEDNEMTVIENPTPSPEELVVEIKRYLNQTKENIIEIGNLLIQAKKQVSHGEWGKWLADNIDFTVRTADRFMKCAARFGNWTASSNLNSSQMFELLALKAADTEEFFDSKAAAGTPVENMPSRVLREEVKKWRNEKKSVRKKSETSQENEPEIRDEDIQRLNQIFILSDELTQTEYFKNVLKKYAENNPDSVSKYAANLVRISQTIKKYIHQ